MKQTRTFILTGPWGSGKTVMAVSYFPKDNPTPKRLIIDKEARALEYNSEYNGLTGDHPDRLLYSYNFWPDEYGDYTLDQFCQFIKDVRAGKIQYDVYIWENLAQAQEDIEEWCQTAAGSEKILAALDKLQKHTLFLKYRFTQDAYWRSMVKDVLFNVIMLFKRSGADVVLTTELRNIWQDYGAKGLAEDGKPRQRIIGKTAKAWDAAFRLADTIWHLNRSTDKVLTAPTVSIDPKTPKCSIVGVPPTFKFEGWQKIWEFTEARVKPDEAAFSKVEMPSPEFVETEADPLEDGKARLVSELMAAGYTDRQEIGKTLKAQGLEYTLEAHEVIREKLASMKVGTDGK